MIRMGVGHAIAILICLLHARFVSYASGGHILVGHMKEAITQIVAFLK